MWRRGEPVALDAEMIPRKSVSPDTARKELEGRWRMKLEQAQERFKIATKHYRELLADAPEGLIPSLNSPLARARRTESDALATYLGLLRISIGIIQHGRANGREPRGRSTAETNGMRHGGERL